MVRSQDLNSYPARISSISTAAEHTNTSAAATSFDIKRVSHRYLDAAHPREPSANGEQSSPNSLSVLCHSHSHPTAGASRREMQGIRDAVLP
jgi:hypothetical protein